MATIYDLEQQAKTIAQQQEIIEKQKIVIDELLKAVRGYLNSIGTKREIDKLSDLKAIYMQASMEES